MEKRRPLLAKLACISPFATSTALPSYCAASETLPHVADDQRRLATMTEKTAQTNDPTGDEAGDR
jgi:hypothetical protein